MFEPIDPPIPCPKGGWPRAADRVDLVGVNRLHEAAFELSALSRRRRIGVVAAFEGSDLYAYPHQTVAEIQRVYQRMRDLARGGLATALEPVVERWTPRRKLTVVLAIQEGMASRLDMLTLYGLSAEELASWEARFREHGPNGLAQLQARALPLSKSDEVLNG